MKRALPIAALLLACAAGVWVVVRPATSPTAAVDDGLPDETDREDAPLDPAAGPASAASASPVAPAGAAQLSGVVRKDGVAVSARLSLRCLSSRAGRSFGRGGRGPLESLLAAPLVDADACRTARTDADGRYTVGDLGAGVYEVCATTDSGARGSVEATIRANRARVEADIEVHGGAERLAGRVLHADGRPWSGVVLVEQTRGASGASTGLSGAAVRVEADQSGSFEAAGLEAGDVSVTAIAPGAFRATSAPVRLPRAEPFVLTIDAAFTTLRGRVVADEGGQPLADARVTALGHGGALALVASQSTTDPAGRFELGVPAGDSATVWVEARGFAPEMKQGADLAAGQSIEFRLTRSARLVGRVSRALDGSPVVGATLRARSLEDRGMPVPDGTATTGPDGRFVIDDAPPGEILVLAEAAGLVTMGRSGAEGSGAPAGTVVARPGGTTTVDLVLVAGARAVGSVTDAGGAPVEGAVVVATRADARAGRSPDAAALDPLHAVSSADGTFVIDTLVAPCRYDFEAERAGFAPCRVEGVTASDRDPVVVTLRFAPVRMVDVAVLDAESGRPVAGARVTTSGDGGGARVVGPSGVTGADGHVKLGPMGPGGLSVSAESDDYVRSLDTVAVGDSDTTAVVTLRRGLEVVGRVTFARGVPAAGAEVAITGDGLAAGAARTTTSARDGAFRFRGVPDGSIRVAARLTRDGSVYAAHTSVAVGGGDVLLTLVEGGEAAGAESESVRVRVRGPDGSPLASGTARLTANGTSATKRVADGRVDFARPARESARLEIFDARASDGTRLDAQPSRRVIGPADTDVDIRLEPSVSIEGRILGPDGRGLPGVTVHAVAKVESGAGDASEGRSGAGGASRSDDAGRFRIDGLGDEDYRLVVDAPDSFEALEGTTVHGGAAGVELSLARGLAATVTVLDRSGEPLPGMNVVVRSVVEEDAAGRRPRRTAARASTTDARGMARVTGLPRGATHRLDVDGADVAPFHLESWAPADVTIRLDRTLSITGVVQDKAARPVGGAVVQWSEDGRAWRGVDADPNGRFTIGGLAAGRWSVRAVLAWRTSHELATGDIDVRRVDAGAKDLVLTIDAGLDLVVRIENWPGDAPPRHGATLTLEGTGERSREGDSATPELIDASGVVRFRGLTSSATYRLWVPPIAGGRSCLATGLRAGGAEARVRLAEGRSISGRIKAPVEAGAVRVVASSDVLSASTTLDAEGRYTIVGLPDGTYRVDAQAGAGGSVWRAGGSVAAGGTLDLELEQEGR